MKLPVINKLLLSIVLLSGLFLIFTASQADASAKRRVAVMPFSYGSVGAEVGTTDVGQASPVY
jgi:hypothetical protein